MTREQRFRDGKAVLDSVNSSDAQGLSELLADIAPELAYQAVAFGYGDIYSRPGLSAPQRQLVTLGMLTALGTQLELEWHVRSSLNVGLTPTEIVEALMQSAVYCGFPRAVDAVLTAKKVFAERDLLPVVSGDSTQ